MILGSLQGCLSGGRSPPDSFPNYDPRPALTLELVTRTQQILPALMVVVRQAIAPRIHVLVLELVGEIERLECNGEVAVHIPGRRCVDSQGLGRAFDVVEVTTRNCRQVLIPISR